MARGSKKGPEPARGESLNLLKAISDDVIANIRQMSAEEFGRVLVHREYHEFGKDDFTAGFVDEVLSRRRLNRTNVQIDIVSVCRDLTHQLHYHREAHAYIVVLGPTEHVPAPQTAEACVGEQWFPVSSGQALSIPPGMPHTFRVKQDSGDVLRFLSVQSPPIVRDLEDDYYLVQGKCSPMLKG